MNDLAARARIRSDLSNTFVVEAAAGTGKTTELVARVIALLRTGASTLDRILCVTFTDLAAGEMKLRLRSELESARRGANAAELQRFDRALAQLEVAPIGTIHSFCADLLRERPVEARIDPLFEVAANDAQDRLYGQAFSAWFQETAARPPDGVRRLLRRKVRSGEDPPRELLRDAGLRLCEHRDFDGAWRREPFDRGGLLRSVLDEIAALGALVPSRADDWIAKCLADLARFAAEQRRYESLRGRLDLDALEADLRDLLRFRSWGWSGGGKWFNKELEKKLVVERRDALKARISAALEQCDADTAALLREELRPLCDRYEELKQGAGALDFLDLLLRARDLVRDHAGVRRELQQGYSHILVDEFQDTDPLQAEILLLLASGDPAQHDWRAVRPVPGKLFVVGDPKQSIYRFRRADIALYEEVKQLLLASGAELLHLTTSFRSVPALQEAINASFSLQMTGGAQAAYVPLSPERPAIAGQPALIALPAPWLYDPRREKLANTRIEKSYPGAVAAFVEWLLRESRWQVSERGKGLVPVEGRHVCLLFKRKRGWGGEDLARSYVRALEARRISHVLVGGRGYHAREEILALRAAAAAIEWPEDELSVFATLKGPLFALSDEALLLHRAAHGRLRPHARLHAEDPEPVREVGEALRLLSELHRERNKRPIAETLSRLLDATRAHAGIAIRSGGEQALGNVLRLLTLARRFEAAGASSFRAFVDNLAEEAERGEASEAPVVEEGADGVRIMSVHKAKGLEFPVVILCDPCAKGEPRNPSRAFDTARRVWAMPLAHCAPAELLARKEEVLQRDREEAVRVAYVAATRARDLLVVPACGDEELKGWLEPLTPALYPLPDEREKPRPAPGCPPFSAPTVLDRPDGLLAEAPVRPGLHKPRAGAHEVVWWHATEPDLEGQGGLLSNDLLVESGNSQASAAAHEAWQREHARALAEGARPSLRIETATALSLARTAPEPGAWAAAREVASEQVEGRERERPRGKRFGALVHAALAEAPLGADGAAVARVAAMQGRMLLASEDEVLAAARAVAAALAHPLLRRAANALEVRREEPLLHVLDDGTLLEGVIDLAFREPSGWTVVDFKTDAQPAAAPHYAEQLRLYCAAIEAATGAPATGVLLAV